LRATSEVLAREILVNKKEGRRKIKANEWLEKIKWE